DFSTRARPGDVGDHWLVGLAPLTGMMEGDGDVAQTHDGETGDATARAGTRRPVRPAGTHQAFPGRAVGGERPATVGGPGGAPLPGPAPQRGFPAPLDSPLARPPPRYAAGVRVAVRRRQPG